MAVIQIKPLDFLGQQGALLEPADPKLHDAAVEFCARNLRDQVNLSKFAKVWVGLKDEYVFGIAGYVLRPDIPLFRATDADVLRALGYRLNSFFSDNGCRGTQVFIHIGNESPDQRCPEWRQVLKEFGAQSGRRVLVEVR
jgi:hypothetical protein